MQSKQGYELLQSFFFIPKRASTCYNLSVRICFIYNLILRLVPRYSWQLTMKKDRTSVSEADNSIMEVESGGKPTVSYEERCQFLNPIAQPLASRKLTKKIYKLIKKSAKQKLFWSGLKDVQKQLRIGKTGIVILGGDVLPVDVYSHLPAVCEDKDIPYCYVPSKDDIGTAMGVQRSVVAVFIGPNPEVQELYDEMYNEIKSLPIPFQS